MKCCTNNQESADYQPLPVPATSDTRSRRFVTVEPAIACYMLGFGFIVAVRTEYIQRWISRVHNYTLPNNVENGTCLMNKSSEEAMLQTKIQIEGSSWLIYFAIASTIPSMFMTVIIGAWGDSIGRRFALVIPSIGLLQHACCWFLTATYDLPLEFLVGSMFLQGLMGGYALFVASCFTYISDITTKTNRTTHLIIGEFILLSCSGVAQVIAGYILDKYDFIVVFIVAAGLSGTTVLYLAVPLFLPETVVKSKVNHVAGLKSSLRGILNIAVKKTAAYRKTFYVVNVNVIAICIFASGALLPIHFLGEPFCFSYMLYGYYLTTLISCPAIGLLSALVLKRFMDDYWLLHLSVLSSMAFLIVSALAQTTPLAFVGTGLGIFNAVFVPACRSILSKISSPEEQGAVYGCLGFSEALALFLCPLVLNNIYSATVSSMPTFVFWLCAGVCFLPSILTGYLQYGNRIGQAKRTQCPTTTDQGGFI